MRNHIKISSSIPIPLPFSPNPKPNLYFLSKPCIYFFLFLFSLLLNSPFSLRFFLNKKKKKKKRLFSTQTSEGNIYYKTEVTFVKITL